MYIRAQEFHGSFYRIPGVVPRLTVVSVVKLFTEPAYVVCESFKVTADHFITGIHKSGQSLFAQSFSNSRNLSYFLLNCAILSHVFI